MVANGNSWALKNLVLFEVSDPIIYVASNKERSLKSLAVSGRRPSWPPREPEPAQHEVINVLQNTDSLTDSFPGGEEGAPLNISFSELGLYCQIYFTSHCVLLIPEHR